MHHLLKDFSTLGSLNIFVLAKLGILIVKLFVASFEEITFRIKELGVSLRVYVPVKVSHLEDHVRSTLLTKLTVEDKDSTIK